MAKIGCMLVSLYVLGISTKYSNADGFTSILEKGEMNYAVGVESAKNVALPASVWMTPFLLGFSDAIFCS